MPYINFSITPEDGKKINMIKEVRAAFGMGLKEAKDLVEIGGYVNGDILIEAAFFRQLSRLLQNCAVQGLVFSYTVSHTAGAGAVSSVSIPINTSFGLNDPASTTPAITNGSFNNDQIGAILVKQSALDDRMISLGNQELVTREKITENNELLKKVYDKLQLLEAASMATGDAF